MRCLRNFIFILPLTFSFFLYSEPTLQEEFFPKYYIKAQAGSAIGGTFSAYSYHAMLKMDQLESEALLGAAIGVCFDPHWRVELNARQRVGMRYQRFNETINSFEFSVGYMDSRTLTLGAFYEFGKLGRASPYLGLGLGGSRNTLRDAESLNNIELGLHTLLGAARKNSLCYFIGAGIVFDLIEHLKLDVNYSFFNLGNAQTDEAGREVVRLQNIRLHEVCVGLVAEI
jgi:opacity protein-like surface antigen